MYDISDVQVKKGYNNGCMIYRMYKLRKVNGTLPSPKYTVDIMWEVKNQ